MRAIKGRALNLRHTFLDETEESPLSLTSVDVTLLDEFGDEVATASATDNGEGEWSASFPAQPMGLYVAQWVGDETTTDETPVEVVGGFLFTVPQARNSDEYLTDPSEFPAAEIIDYREVVESEFEDITGRSFTTRVQHRDYVSDGSGEFLALIPDAQAVEAVWIDGTAVDDVSGWTVNRLGKVTAPEMVECDKRVRVRIRYGFPTPPAGVARVGMVYLRYLMAAESSGIPDRATTWQPEEGGTFRLATPGMGNSETGIPDVDATLKRYALDVVLAVYAGG